MKTYTTAEVRMLTGIQVTGDYRYELSLLTLDDLDIKYFDKKTLALYKKTDTVKSIIKGLENGRTFPPIILYPREAEKKLRIADGCHRISSYIFNNTKEFYGLIKILTN